MIKIIKKLKQIKANKLFSLLLLCFFINTGCVGTFKTTDRLSNDYSSMAKDENITLFYNYSVALIDINIKNTGSSFINRFNISFNCVSHNKEKNKIKSFSLGEIKPYFSKKVSIPINLNDCDTFFAEYSFIPSKDGNFIDNKSKTSHFINSPVYPIQKIINIK